MKPRRFRITRVTHDDKVPPNGDSQRSASTAVAEAASGCRGQSELYVIDDGFSRCLHFGPDYVQSRMSADQPDALSLTYTRKMMAFLLFCPQPKDVVIVGLGGGSLTKFCYRHLPRTRITTVEINAQVIGLGPTFNIPPPDERMRIVHADAVDYFATTSDRADVVLLDGCDESGLDPAFCNERFYRTVRARLRPHGVLVANLVGMDKSKSEHAELIARVFDNCSIVLKLTTEANRVAFAFNDSWAAPDWEAVYERAGELARKLDLEFPGFAQKIHRCYQQQEWNRAKR